MAIAVVFLFSSVLQAQWVRTSFSAGGNNVTSLAVRGGKIFAGTLGSYVYVSGDSGATWTQVSAGLADTNVYAVAANGTKVYAGTDSGLYVTTNDGVLWASAGIYGDGVLSICLENDTIVAGSDSGYVYFSTNSGETWTRSFPGMASNFPHVSGGVAVYNGVVYAGGENLGLYSTADLGAHWTFLNDPNQAIHSFIDYAGSIMALDLGGVIIYSNGAWSQEMNAGITATSDNVLFLAGPVVFIGTGSGVFLTVDGAISWTDVTAGMPPLANVNAFALIGTYLIAGGNYFSGPANDDSSSIWRTNIKQYLTGVNEKTGAAPGAFLLGKNYPNPFSDATTISYSLSAPAPVTISVYTVTGEKVATLVSGTMDVGQHSVLFNANGLKNGVYYYRLTAGKYSQTASVIVAH